MRRVQIVLQLILLFFLSTTVYGGNRPDALKFLQHESADYLNNFQQLIENSYAAVDDPEEGPDGLVSSCSNLGTHDASGTITVSESSPTVIGAAALQQRCGENSLCIVGNNVTVEIDDSLKLHSLIVKDGGTIRWTDQTQVNAETWLCAGYAVIEKGGTWDMNLQDAFKRAWIYIMDNGATHPMLRTRVFGSGNMGTGPDAYFSVIGRELARTWSLLAEPLALGDSALYLMHNPIAMGWRVGDRIAVAPTERLSGGDAQSFFITAMFDDGTIELDSSSSNSVAHLADRIHVGEAGASLRSAEVINLSRNIIVTGDDFKEIACDASLEEVFSNFGTSDQGCSCDNNYGRTSCTVGLQTASAHGGYSEVANVRIEKCGQRGIEGKYCLHMHHMSDCADDSAERGTNCISRNNAVEFSQQRGQIIHSTHNALIESNVLYDIRGAYIYIEDGNEMYNAVNYNVGICPYYDLGCTLPGTSNQDGDTALNQTGIYMETPNNLLLGNRMANHFNGHFSNGGNGRGPTESQVCTWNLPMGLWEGNTFHSSGRFGTYLLNVNFPRQNTGQSLGTNGTTNYSQDCAAYDDLGNDLGAPHAILNHFDYGNNYVGQYDAGDVQYKNHVNIDNLWSIYWKTTKTFQDGCSAHISDSYYESGGAMELPDAMGAFIVENTTFKRYTMNANHHCDVGGTGILCMPQYVLHNLEWLEPKNKYVNFDMNNGDTNRGGIFTLSPDNIADKENGAEFPLFPTAYNSVVGDTFEYLEALPGCIHSSDINYGDGVDYASRYDNGILCEAFLTPLKIFSPFHVGRYDNAEDDAYKLLLTVFDNDTGDQLAVQEISPVRVTDTKQGYSMPVIAGDQYRYEIRLASGADINPNWIIDFGDLTVSNRWGVQHLHLSVQGRECNGTIYSNHDRRYYFMAEELGDTSWGRGACTVYESMPAKDCSVIPDLTANIDPVYSEWKTALDTVCSSVDCGENGACSAHYLGGETPVLTPYQCVCKSGWTGDNCELEDLDSLPTPTPTPGVDRPPSGSVTGLMLVDANADQILGSLAHGDYILQPEVGSALNVVLETTGTIGRVEFSFGSAYEFSHTEGGAPYALGGNAGTNYNVTPYLETLGEKHLQVTAYSPENTEIGRVVLTFSIVDELPTPTPEPTSAVTPTPEPTSAVTPTPEPTSVVTPTPEPTSVVTPTPEPTSVVTPTPEPTSVVTPTPEPTSVVTPTPEPTSAVTPTPEPTNVATPTPDPTSVVTPTPEPNGPATPTPEPNSTATPTPASSGGGGGGSIGWASVILLLLLGGLGKLGKQWQQAKKVTRFRKSRTLNKS